MISQRAWLIGAVGFCFYLIAIVNTLPSFYYALTWLAAGVLASSLGIALLSLAGLRCAWRAPRAVVSSTLGEATSSSSALVEVQIANAGTLNKTGVLIEVVLERQNVATPIELTQRFLLEALPSGQSLATQLPLATLSRGRYRITEVRLVGSDVLGLFRLRKRVPPDLTLDATMSVTKASHEQGEADEVVIGPATVAPSGLSTRAFTAALGTGGATATRLLGPGDELRGTRLYAPGDDLRYVHWHSTARRGQLVVKEFHHTQQTRALVVWDGVGDAHSAAPRHDKALELGLCLAASLCRAFEEQRHVFSLLRLDAHPLHVGDGFAPNGSQIAAALADARADRTTSLAQALDVSWTAERSASTHADSASSRAELFLITTSLAPEVAQAILWWRSSGAPISIALLERAAFEGTADATTRVHLESQLKTLRAAGAHVIAVAPQPDAEEAVILGAALHALLHREPTARTFQSVQAREVA